MGQYDYAYVTITPGELLKEEFLEPLGISQYRLPPGRQRAPCEGDDRSPLGGAHGPIPPPIRTCASAASSASRTAIGSVPRRPTTPRSPSTSSPTSSRRSRRFTVLRR